VAGRIVVGVDGSDGSLAALRWALAEAELRQAEVEAVFAWSYPYVGELTGMSMSMVDRDELEADAKAVIAQAAAKLPADEIRAPLHEVIAEGSAAQVLTDLAQGADLLVVSSRGRGGLKGLLLGSVSQQVAHHAPCPVVIIPISA
jgi:nucleotide-binding universal stress UspA family protein